MSEANSPFFQRGLHDGAADAMRSPRVRRGFAPDGARSWMYRRGFARGFLAVRKITPPDAAAMQAGLDDALAAIEAAGWRMPAASSKVPSR